jgi:hypothetical protein
MIECGSDKLLNIVTACEAHAEVGVRHVRAAVSIDLNRLLFAQFALVDCKGCHGSSSCEVNNAAP